MWINAESGWDGIEIIASLSCGWGVGRGDGSIFWRMDRKREMWDRRVVNREGWVARSETACEEVVARREGREAENTEAEELIRWLERQL